MKRELQVLILGGGLAGLTAAYTLHKQGISFGILEARDRLGGRIHTLNSPAKGTVEMGATWFADKHVHLMQLIADMGIAYEPQYIGDKMLYDFGHPDRVIQLVDLSPGQEPSYVFSKGSQSLIEALAEMVPMEGISLNEAALSIRGENEWIITETDEASYVSSFVISTLPPALFQRILPTTPILPEALLVNAKNTHTWMGESMKVGLRYRESFWRKMQIGTFFSQVGPIQELHDHIHEGQQVPFLKGFLHPQARRLSKKELEERIHQQMCHYFGPEVSSPEAIYFLDWMSEPFTYHAYEGYVGPHQNNGLSILRESYLSERLLFAGSETARHFPGYMDGAVERGQSVARQIIDRLQAT